MCRREQPASASAPATRALAVVVDPTVGVYEPSNAPFIEVVEGVDARPGRERDARFHRGIGRKDNVLVIPLDDLLQLLGELGHSQLYCTTTPPSSRLCTWSSGWIGRV